MIRLEEFSAKNPTVNLRPNLCEETVFKKENISQTKINSICPYEEIIDLSPEKIRTDEFLAKNVKISADSC